MRRLSEQDMAGILKIHDQWIREELAGNSSQLIELCTNDVRWMPPNSPPLEGKQAIAQYLDNNRVDLADVKVTEVLIRGSDSLAYLTGNFYSRYTTQNSSEIQEAAGTHLWILRKKGRLWQVAVIAWNLWHPVGDRSDLESGISQEKNEINFRNGNGGG